MSNFKNLKQPITTMLGTRSPSHKDLLSALRRIAKSDTPGSGWFQRRKAAIKEIDILSGGDLVLTSNYYRSDEERHWVTHTKCGNRFRVSLWELRNESVGACPYCAQSPEMDRFGTVNDVFNLTHRISNGKTQFVKNQRLASAESWYAFYCMVCREPYDCDFINFRNNANGDRGCSKCRQK